MTGAALVRIVAGRRISRGRDSPSGGALGGPNLEFHNTSVTQFRGWV